MIQLIPEKLIFPIAFLALLIGVYTIKSMQIYSLESKISSLTLEINNHVQEATRLNSQIIQLQESIQKQNVAFEGIVTEQTSRSLQAEAELKRFRESIRKKEKASRPLIEQSKNGNELDKLKEILEKYEEARRIQ
jgi:TolA-binding protein